MQSSAQEGWAAMTQRRGGGATDKRRGSERGRPRAGAGDGRVISIYASTPPHCLAREVALCPGLLCSVLSAAAPAAAPRVTVVGLTSDERGQGSDVHAGESTAQTRCPPLPAPLHDGPQRCGL